MAHLPAGSSGRTPAARDVAGARAADDAARRAARAVARPARRRDRRRQRPAHHRRRRRPGAQRHGHLVPERAVPACAAPVPRPHRDRPRVARRQVAGVGGHHRAPRATRAPRPVGHAPRPGLRARPHVHVAVLDTRVAVPSRDHGRPPRIGASRAGAPAAVRRAGVRHLHLAPRRRATRRGVGGVELAAGATPVRPGHHRTTRQGDPGHGQRAVAPARASRRLATVVRPGGQGPSRHRAVALGCGRCSAPAT